ncbi:G-patch domain [Trinorchestia longiramus]|nr:G-patch domain [Trinorchestia longiramus]
MSDDEDDFAFYGTSVEQLDADNFTRKKAPRLEDQTVTDKQGRRRFHGAFTGGFSAGHFNTVGSLEGFTPSTFTSSRVERNKEQRAQNIEMFMDEEDLSAHGIAAQRLQPAADFGGGGGGDGNKRKRIMPSTGPIPGMPVLLDFTVNTSESVGARLLRRLGWREGQGVGPRLSHKQKRKSRASKQPPAKGLSGLSDSDSELPSCYTDVTFAPDDCESAYLASLERKDNTFGLGYKPLSRESVLGNKERQQSLPFAVTEKKKTMTIKGQAFGVGAFEEEDDDIYAQEDMSDYNFALGGSAEPTSATKNGGAARASGPSVGSVCQLLEGFVLSTTPVQPTPGPPLPRLPPDYVPQHRPLRKRFSGSAPLERGLGRHDIGPGDRSRIRDAPAACVEVRTGVKGQEPSPPSPPAALPPLPPELLTGDGPSGPASGYQPFASDADKQKRYELYLRMKEKGLKSRFSEVQPAWLTEWERDREGREFERAAQLYKPLTTAMATRFVSSSASESTPLLKDGLNMSIKKVNPVLDTNKASGLADSTGSTGPSAALSSDPRLKAAQTSMFGQLTLSVQRWHPDKLLCRRFNVPPPYPDSRRVGVVSDTGRNDRHDAFDEQSPLAVSTRTVARQDSRHNEAPDDGADETQTRVEAEETPETYGLKVPVTGPPTMDLFKAIFEGTSSSSDSSDSDSEEDSSKTRYSPVSSSRGTEEKIEQQESQKKELPPSRRARKSRFEPRQEDVLAHAGAVRDDQNSQNICSDETAASELPKHVFISQKNKSGIEQAGNGIGKQSSKSKKRSTSVVKSSLSFMIESDQSDEESSKQSSKRESNSRSSSHSTAQKDSKFQSSSKVSFETEETLKVSQANSSKFCSSADPSSDQKPSIFMKEDVRSRKPSKADTGSNSTTRNFSNFCSEPAVPISELPKPIPLSQSQATGIFADLDFSELNKYREFIGEPSKEADSCKTKATEETICKPLYDLTKMSTSETVRKVLDSESEASENSSVDSDEQYGAALPPNYVNPLQVIRDRRTTKVGSQLGGNFTDGKFVEKSQKALDSRHKAKKKKSEKKKKHKKKMRKESKKTSKRKKKIRERSDSSSSSSD